jgi:hypothetical protein
MITVYQLVSVPVLILEQLEFRLYGVLMKCVNFMMHQAVPLRI